MIIGLDVGGTHTDVVLLGNEGLINEVKVSTNPADLFNTVLSGLHKITEGVNPDQINRMVLSTTLTTNAIVQKDIPPVGMIVSGGPGIDPELYRTNSHYVTVAGFIDHRGREIEPVNPKEIKKIGKRLKKEGIRNVGVAGKFSVRNPAHELAIGEILSPLFDKVFLGHHISGNLSFPRRIATTYLNTAVYPVHKEFFAAVKKSLEKKGLRVPIRILKADGGNMNFESSIDFPTQTILSGPAASVMGSIAFAPEEEACLVLDIGGTTTDMSILIDQVPLLNPKGIVMGGYKTLIRSLETYSTGLGGDSEVRLVGGQIRVGPHRIGAAMAYGGPVPTPTDALVILGKIQEGDREKAEAGLMPMAKELGLSLEETARRIFDHTCRKILDEAAGMIERINAKPVYTVHEMLEGYQVRPRKMLVLGGPALHFAKYLEEISDYKVGVVPRWKVANAIGAALARTTCEVTVFADTEQGMATAPQENFCQTVNKGFTKDDAVKTATDLLREKALKRGANPDHLDVEIIEEQQFNMVRGFYTSGKNIRVRAQIKPGLIHGYDPVAGRLV